MAPARLTAAGSLLVATGMAVFVPNVSGVGLAALVGWLAVALFALALIAGEVSLLTIGATLFVVRLGMIAPLQGPVTPPVWTQAFLLVIAVELGLVSVDWRSAPRVPVLVFSRAALAGLVTLVVSLVLESAVYGFSGGGVLLRVAAVGAAVLLVGWILWMWRRVVSPRP